MAFGTLPPRLPFRHPAAWLATWFGSGLLPWAPGTWGSLAALPPAWLVLHYLGPIGLAVAAVVVFALGQWAAGVYLARSDRHDPPEIVIDEVAGLMLALLPAAPDVWWQLALAFVLFRLFDIVKPWPARGADRKVPGALGVMLDDAIAGLYGAGVLLLIVWQARHGPPLS